MAIIRLKEIQGMSSKDRNKKLVDLRVELARIRTMVNAGGAVENPTKIREIRKTIAQILTVENEDKLHIRKGAEEEEEEEKLKKKAEKPVAEKPEKKTRAKKQTEETTSQ
jgi:large subunit ribosomal protein L29